MKKTNLLIIGGGPAGLFLSNLYKNSILLEKEKSCGKKLLLTGGGMCNFTHKENAKDLINHYYEKKNFVSSAIGSFPPDKIIAFFKERHVESFIREDGCVFPKSKDSKTVLKALLDGAGEIENSVNIKSIKKEDELFTVITDEDIYQTNNLVIATGGQSYPGTGSCGDGYNFAKEFGHKIVPIKPGLSEIKLSLDVSKLEGISIDNVTLKASKESKTGSIIFTKRGISGPAAMCISRFIDNSKITICFYPINEQELLEIKSKKSIKNVLKELTQLPNAVLEYLFSFSEKSYSQLTAAERKEIVRKLNCFETEATTSGLLKIATVTKGGVDTEEINKKTFESKLVKNLYFIGEVLDVDGECGGYNLTFAFSSAYSVYKALTTVL